MPSQIVVPAWMVKTAVGALIGLLVTGVGAWGTHLSQAKNTHEVRIGVVETKIETIKDDIREIKTSQKEILQKLDKMQERQPHLYGR